MKINPPRIETYYVVTNGTVFAVADSGGEIIGGSIGTRLEAERRVKEWNHNEKLKAGEWKVAKGIFDA